MSRFSRIPVAKPGFAFIFPAISLGLLAFFFDVLPAAIFFSLIALALIFFFRDPERKGPYLRNHLLAPADGKVVDITKEDGAITVSIFLSLYDVHIVRSPLEGIIASVKESPGGALPASKREASRHNRSKTLFIKGPKDTVELKMIVGVAARRIFCYVRPSEKVFQGQRVGLMAFGSRVEISVPAAYALKVKLGQKVKGGITALAEINYL